MSTTAPVLEVDGLVKHFPVTRGLIRRKVIGMVRAVEGVSFDELREGQTVEYQEGQGPKGPRAENVRPV